MGIRILLTAFMVLAGLPLLAAGEVSVQYSQFVFSLVIIFVMLAFGVQALLYNYRNRFRGRKSFWKYAGQHPLVRLFGGVIAVVVMVSTLVPDPWTDEPYEMAAYAELRKMPGSAAIAHQRLAKRFPFVMDHHYAFVSAYYRADEWADMGSVTVTSNWRTSPIMHYQGMVRDWSPGMRDVAYLGLGMADYFEYMRSLARDQLLKIEDTTLAYRNLFLGRIAEYFGEVSTAHRYYRQEFAYGGARKLAVEGMTNLKFKYDRQDLDGIEEILNYRPFQPYIPQAFKRYYYVKEAKLGRYFADTLSAWWKEATVIGWMGAGLGLLIWIFFLRRVDIYQKRSWWLIGELIVLSGLFAFTALPLYDAVRFELGFQLNGEFWNDFLYCIFGIGVIEELVKLLPVLIVLQLGQKARGPMDYLIYGSLSALGFAFVENIMYFDGGSVSIIFGRVLVAAVFHMFATSTVVFGIILGRYRFPKWKIPLVILFFFLGALVHGVYDFWLLNPQVSGFSFMAYVVFVYATFQYAAYINNCLNNSPFFQWKRVLNTERLVVFLLVSLMGALMFEYVGMSVAYGASFGNFELVKSVGMGGFLTFFVVMNLSFIDVVRGEWFGLRLWNFSNRGNYNLLVGKRVGLLPGGEKGLLGRALPAKGEVIARIRLHESNRYYLLELEQPIPLVGHAVEYVILRARERGAVLEPGFGMEVGVLAFRDRKALLRKNKRRDDFRLLGYAVLK